MINKKIILLLSVLALVFTSACDDDDTETIYGNWVKADAFSGNGRSDAISFTLGDATTGETFFYGLGYNGNNTLGNRYLSDFYSYEGGTTWTPLAAFPGKLRIGAVSFGVNGKGYVACGYNYNVDSMYCDVWEYDPTSNAWSQIADFPGGKRKDATSFVVDGKAYIVAGRSEFDGNKKDCWEFDATTKTFTQIEDLGAKHYAASAFVIDSIAYVLGGYNNTIVSEVDVFDATQLKWNVSDVRDLYLPSSITDDISDYDDPIDLRRAYSTVFVVDQKAYLVGGNNGSILSDCWEYDYEKDIWTEMNNFPALMPARYRATSFVLDGVPYVVGGTNGTTYFDDVWTFEPTEEADDTDD